MLNTVKKVLILVCVLTLAIPLYAQNKVGDSQEPKLPPEAEAISEGDTTEVASPPQSEQKTTNPFLDFINKKAYAAKIDEKEEKRILREKWKKLLKIDVFFPYFKAKEVEDWVSDKASVNFFNLRGRPKFENNQFKYTFKLNF